MGCNSSVDTECATNESPKHNVTLAAFAIDKTEVTVSQYKACVDGGGLGCTTPDTTTNCNWGVADRGNHPINCVDWAQAAAYCAWVDKRLPTEAEWEKAARGTDGRKYPWGNTSIDCTFANTVDCLGRTRPVGGAQGASPYGALDMMGNVVEWGSDWYDATYYTSSPANDPTGPATGTGRVLRGGAWSDVPASARASNRGKGDSASWNDNTTGFRCAN